MSNHKNTTIKQLFYNKQLIVNYVKVNLYCTTLEKNTNLLHKYLKKIMTANLLESYQFTEQLF